MFKRGIATVVVVAALCGASFVGGQAVGGGTSSADAAKAGDAPSAQSSAKTDKKILKELKKLNQGVGFLENIRDNTGELCEEAAMDNPSIFSFNCETAE